MGNEGPCQGCYAPKRKMFCHSYCQEYINWTKEQEEKKKKERERKKSYDTVSEHAKRSMWRKMRWGK